MAEIIEGLIVIDEGTDPETSDSFFCCWTAIMIIH